MPCFYEPYTLDGTLTFSSGTSSAVVVVCTSREPSITQVWLSPAVTSSPGIFDLTTERLERDPPNGRYWREGEVAGLSVERV